MKAYQILSYNSIEPGLTLSQRTELLALEDVTAYLGSMAISEGGLSEVPEDDSSDEFS